MIRTNPSREQIAEVIRWAQVQEDDCETYLAACVVLELVRQRDRAEAALRELRQDVIDCARVNATVEGPQYKGMNVSDFRLLYERLIAGVAPDAGNCAIYSGKNDAMKPAFSPEQEIERALKTAALNTRHGGTVGLLSQALLALQAALSASEAARERMRATALREATFAISAMSSVSSVPPEINAYNNAIARIEALAAAPGKEGRDAG